MLKYLYFFLPLAAFVLASTAYADQPLASSDQKTVSYYHDVLPLFQARCQGCHQQAYTWWRGTPHGRAYETLTSRHKEFHLECVGCHVTGYELPGGSTVTHNMDGAAPTLGLQRVRLGARQRQVQPLQLPVERGDDVGDTGIATFESVRLRRL